MWEPGWGCKAPVRLDRSHELYAGYSATQFDLDPIDDMHASDRGFAAGLVRSFPQAGGRSLVPWVRAGVLAHRLSVVRRGNAGEESGPADGSVGFEAGAGIGVQRNRIQAMLGPNYRAYPTLGLEYRVYRARVLGAERETVSYVALRGGVTFAF